MEIKDFKMVVTPGQSEIVQEFLFKNGYYWRSKVTNIQYTNLEYLFFSNKRGISVGRQQEDFNEKPFTELTFEQFQELYMKETKQDNVNHPNHYTNYPIEVIDMMISIFGKEDVAKYCLINAYKYRMRLGLKNPDHFQEDFEKEQWYLNKYKELNNDTKG